MRIHLSILLLTYYRNEQDNKQSEIEQNRETEVDSSFQRRNTFSEKELEKKRLWMQQMKQNIQKSKNDYFAMTSPEHSKASLPIKAEPKRKREFKTQKIIRKRKNISKVSATHTKSQAPHPPSTIKIPKVVKVPF
jgi:hypothetical protein